MFQDGSFSGGAGMLCEQVTPEGLRLGQTWPGSVQIASGGFLQDHWSPHRFHNNQAV